MTREEFIGIAADAILKHEAEAGPKVGGRRAQALDPVWTSEIVEVALEAVGAWGARVTLETLKDLHRPTSSGAYCVLCDEMVEPNFPCSTHRAARLGLVL